MKVQRLHAVAGTLFQVTGSVHVVTQIRQEVLVINVVVVKHLAVNVLLNTAFMDADI